MNPSTSNDAFQRMPSLSGENCAVCGDKARSNRLGCSACLGCIIFFQRSVHKNSVGRCTKTGDCPVFNEYRAACRYCRFQKCLKAGMRISAVLARDTDDPRNPLSPSVIIPKHLMQDSLELQEKQFEEYSEQCVASLRRATTADVNDMFKWSFHNAIEWASLFDPFQKISNEKQRCVMSEYGFAYMIIEQGIKSARMWKNGYWILQNGTFLHSDYFHGLDHFEGVVKKETVRQHYEFVSLLETTIKEQFQILQIDQLETAFLKSLILLSSSFPKRNVFAHFQENIDGLKNKCFEELMEYLSEKYPTSHGERFGKLIILIGEIRAAVKAVYNYSKVSDLYNPSNFDKFVQSFFLA